MRVQQNTMGCGLRSVCKPFDAKFASGTDCELQGKDNSLDITFATWYRNVNVKPEEHSLGVQARRKAAGICKHAANQTRQHRKAPDGPDSMKPWTGQH